MTHADFIAARAQWWDATKPLTHEAIRQRGTFGALAEYVGRPPVIPPVDLVANCGPTGETNRETNRETSRPTKRQSISGWLAEQAREQAEAVRCRIEHDGERLADILYHGEIDD